MSSEKEYVLRSNRAAVTRLLALIVDIMDTLLEDWYVYIYFMVGMHISIFSMHLCAAFDCVK